MLGAFDDRRYLIPFRSQLLPHIFTDTLVIGGGVAGLRAAIEVAERGGDVIVLVKETLDVSNTAMAQGGIAAAHASHDTVEAHFDDTVRAGAGLCEPAAVRALVEEGPAAIDELMGWGMQFDRDGGSAALHYGREGGHSRERVLHSGGAATGGELIRCLSGRLAELESIRVFDHCFALDLLTSAGNGERGEVRVLGAVTFHPRYGLQIIWAKATILASGGGGQIYRETTNPRTATGDGVAMAYRAGALVGDLEFVQFHPTTLYVAGAARVLISEAVRGEGAHIVDHNGRRFMVDRHELAELAPRDVVSRAIVEQLALSQAEAVYLDARPLGRTCFAERFPNLMRQLSDFDLDPSADLIPIHPSAHYMIGGVWTDLETRTSLPGLLAVGESACAGLHGANRLASNSLLEGLVFGRRAGQAATRMNDRNVVPLKIVSDIPIREHAELDLEDVQSSLRSAMWRNVGVERSGKRLDDVLDMFRFWARYTMAKIFDEPAGWETQNMLLVGGLVTQAACWRQETRGVHVRIDHPGTSDAARMHALWGIGCREPALRDAGTPVEVPG